MATMEKTTVYLPADLLRRLRATSQRCGLPQAELIREALATFLAGQERPHPQSRGALRSSGVTSANHEKWLHENWDPKTHFRDSGSITPE